MSDRRFTNKPDINPQAVRSLPADHPAMVENRTLFPSTVVEVTKDEPQRILVSGKENRKLGSTVETGPFKGWWIYSLSLEERATCPPSCDARAFCYGNGMQLARRHRIGDPDVFYDRLADEIAFHALGAEEEGVGVLIRLHVLGDFPSAEYVAFWADVLREWPNVACYGYTHWTQQSEIGQAIQAVKDRYQDRFRIRWSDSFVQEDGATIINYEPDGPTCAQGLVCPAQTDATACCATCGLCWSMEARKKTIVFIKHGPKSAAAEFEALTASVKDQGDDEEASEFSDFRGVAPLDLGNLKPAKLTDEVPMFVSVNPEDLVIEESYQRQLSPASLKLIRKIVNNWDWMHFKPPIVAETEQYYLVIDGQHTAIAAATHPDIKEIPVMVLQGREAEARARAFVAQNRNRIALSALQIFHAEFVAGDKDAQRLLKAVLEHGGDIPRSPPARGRVRPGQFLCVSELRGVLREDGEKTLGRIVKICVDSEMPKIPRIVVRALRIILTTEYFQPTADLPDDAIAVALREIGDIDAEARRVGAETEQTIERAAALLIAERAAKRLAA